MNKNVLRGIETKKRIIDCAYKLFLKKGYNNVTVDDIVEESNSSKGSFYTHFKSKEELVLNMAYLADETYENFQKKDIKYIDQTDNILAFIEYVLIVIRDHTGLEFISIVYSSQIKLFEMERFLISPNRSYYKILEELLEKGVANNEFGLRFSVKRTVEILTTIIRGVIYDWCLHKGSFDIIEYGVEIVAMMFKQLKS